jgi:carboxymethylenebutenolidase
MSEREIQVRTPDGEMSTFIAHPDGAGPYPVAVLFMDGVGFREQIRENARRFAAGGFYVVAPDLYHRIGDKLSFDFSGMASGNLSDAERQKMMAAAASVTAENAIADTEAALAATASDPAAAAGPKVAVGYCLGARVSLQVAARLADDFAAAAGIHPGALVTDAPESPHRELEKVRGELYVAFAENDRTATPENVEQFRQELERNHVRGVVERLPGTNHGFAMADLPVYDREASEHHFERTLDLWRRNLSTA